MDFNNKRRMETFVENAFLTKLILVIFNMTLARCCITNVFVFIYLQIFVNDMTRRVPGFELSHATTALYQIRTGKK